MNQRSPLFDLALLVGLVSTLLFLLIVVAQAWANGA